MSEIRINTEAKVKLFLSISLSFYAIIVGVITRNISVIIAMSLSLLGDILLLDSRGCLTGKKENTFIHGVITFTMSHFWYIMAMDTKISNELVCMAFFFLIVALFRLGSSSKPVLVICFLYAGVMILNTINALYYSSITVIGMILFIISDSILIVCKIRERRNLLEHIAIWLTYVLAQTCLLTSILIK